MDGMNNFLVISRVLESGKLKGFLVASRDGRVIMVPQDIIAYMGSNIEYVNAEFDDSYSTLVGTHGISLSTYPSISPDYVLTSRNGIVIHFVVINEQTKEPVGVVAYNAIGTRYTLSFDKLNQVVRKLKPVNFKLSSVKDIGLFPVMLDGTNFPTILMTVRSQQQGVKNLSPGNKIEQQSNDEIPVLTVTRFSSSELEDISKKAQDKLVESLFTMRKISPYYYTILAACTRKPAPGLGTFAVTEDTMYYDMAFVASLNVSELVFVLIHEMMHIVMQHSLRFKGRTDPDLWNVACDLYINSIICHDFNVRFCDDEVVIRTSDGKELGKIKTPEIGVFIETINEKIELDKDTPETIYNRLFKENVTDNSSQGLPMPSNSNSSSSPQGQGGRDAKDASKDFNDAIGRIASGADSLTDGLNQLGATSSDSSQNSGNDSSQNSMQSDLDNINQGADQLQQAGQSLEQSVKNNDMQGMSDALSQIAQGLSQVDSGVDNITDPAMNATQSSGNAKANKRVNQGLGDLKSGINKVMDLLMSGSGQSSGSSSGSGSQNSSANPNTQGGVDDLSSSNDATDQGNQQSEQQGVKEVNVTYNGKKLSGSIMSDIMANQRTNTDETNDKSISQSKTALQRINTKVKMEEEETGIKLAKNAGVGGDLIERYIKFGLSAGVRWQDLLRNLCKFKPKKTFTLANPNQDYMNMGMTLASRRAIGKPTMLSHIKFAVDVSGSVSQKELTYMLSEINNIFTHFKLDGELIYWSTMVGNAGKFSSLKDMLKIKPISDGGTDPVCVFKYLSGVTKVNNKKEEDKVKDIKALFIITDGGFNSVSLSEYARIWDKKTVWMITDNPVTFNPPFGRVIGLDIGSAN